MHESLSGVGIHGPSHSSELTKPVKSHSSGDVLGKGRKTPSTRYGRSARLFQPVELAEFCGQQHIFQLRLQSATGIFWPAFNDFLTAVMLLLTYLLILSGRRLMTSCFVSCQRTQRTWFVIGNDSLCRID